MSMLEIEIGKLPNLRRSLGFTRFVNSSDETGKGKTLAQGNTKKRCGDCVNLEAKLHYPKGWCFHKERLRSASGVTRSSPGQFLDGWFEMVVDLAELGSLHPPCRLGCPMAAAHLGLPTGSLSCFSECRKIKGNPAAGYWGGVKLATKNICHWKCWKAAKVKVCSCGAVPLL